MKKKKPIENSSFILCVNYTVFFKKKGKTTQSTFCQKKSKVSRLLSTEKMNKGDSINITVRYKPGVSNSGEFLTKEQANLFLKNCTDKLQLDYVYKGDWK